MPILSEAEKQAYARDGQLTPAWRLGENRLAALRGSLDATLAATVGQRPDFIPLPHVAPSDADPATVERARGFFEFFSAAEMLDLVEDVIGPDIILWTAALFCKPATTGLAVPWHQDGQYWPIRPRATVTVWIALDDVDSGNGCMRVVPGSHRLGNLHHGVSSRDDLVLNNVLDDDRVDLESARDVVLAAGQVSLHDVDIVHGSAPNTSGRRRAGLAVRYMPSSSLYDREIDPGQASNTVALDFTGRPIWLLRGVDRHGGNDFETGHTHW